jgi:hypothetical protein
MTVRVATWPSAMQCVDTDFAGPRVGGGGCLATCGEACLVVTNQTEATVQPEKP